MHFGGMLRCFFVALLVGGHLVVAGPGGYVTLINGSPYDWKLVYSHQYQMDWKPATIIPAGTISEKYFEYWYNWGDNGDDGAEATYELVGSPQPASFQLQAKQSNGKRLQVQFQGALSSMNNPQNSLINLGYAHDGSVAFILSGDGTQPYVSTNPPICWMQATLSNIGSKNLRQIAMPDSHDAGMSQITRSYGGIEHNTKTQSGNIYQQLTNGARWFDIRPIHRYGEWYTGHFTKVAVLGTVGGMGRMINDIVADVNKFTSQNPGELIILDLSHEMDCASSWIEQLSPNLWQNLYELLGGINDLWVASESSLLQDYSSVPISTFIQPDSKSSVLIRIPDHAPLPRQTASEQSNTPNITIPLSAFVPDSQLAFDGSYSDTDSPTLLAADQIIKLQHSRTFSQSPIQRSTWTITPRLSSLLDIFTASSSIIGQAVSAHRMLFSKLWPALNRNTYPNLIEVDDMNNSQITALCMAINENFARSAVAGVEVSLKREMVVSISLTPTPAVTRASGNVTLPLPTLTPRVFTIRGRTVTERDEGMPIVNI